MDRHQMVQLEKLRAVAEALDQASVTPVPLTDKIYVTTKLHGQTVRDIEDCGPYRGISDQQARELGKAEANGFAYPKNMKPSAELAEALGRINVKKRNACTPK